MSNCIFCNIDKSLWIAENEYFYAIPDKFPEAPGHTLIISKRHCANYTELEDAEKQNLTNMVDDVLKILMCEQFNLKVNTGKDAGQIIFHFHLHVIPR